MKTFRFAGAPDGPLPSIPSGDESGNDSELETEITIRKRIPPMKIRETKKTYKEFPWLCCFSTIFCVFGGITFAIASHKVIHEILNRYTFLKMSILL